MATRSTILLSSLIATTLGGTSIAHAEPPRRARVVDVAIEVGKAPTMLSLSVADRSCSVAETAHADEHLHVEICHEGGAADAPLYAFDVKYERAGATRQRFKVRARVGPGARVILGTVNGIVDASAALRR